MVNPLFLSNPCPHCSSTYSLRESELDYMDGKLYFCSTCHQYISSNDLESFIQKELKPDEPMWMSGDEREFDYYFVSMLQLNNLDEFEIENVEVDTGATHV